MYFESVTCVRIFLKKSGRIYTHVAFETNTQSYNYHSDSTSVFNFRLSYDLPLKSCTFSRSHHIPGDNKVFDAISVGYRNIFEICH